MRTTHIGANSQPTAAAAIVKPTRRRNVDKNTPARITRISIESSSTAQNEIVRPRLKRGVQISRPIAKPEKALILATAHKAISISHPGARAIIAKFDGEHSAVQISEELQAPLEVVENVISELVVAQFLDLTKSTVKLHNRFQSPIAERAVHTEDQSNDASFRQLQLRMAPELSQTTWVENIIDGGVELLSARQSFGIEIHGSNRVATLIFVGLLASGVSNTKFSLTSRCGNYAIGDEDLGTGVLRINDFGLNYKSRVEELSREWSLFPTASKNVKGNTGQVIPVKNLRVIVGNFAPELIDQLMRDHLDHLFVGELIGGAANFGPLVIPNKTPCYQCIELNRSEQYGIAPLVAVHPMSDEPPVSIAYQLAGAAIQTILQFVDTGVCEAIASRFTCDYLTPSRRQPIRFSRHPQCTCIWSAQSYPHGIQAHATAEPKSPESHSHQQEHLHLQPLAPI